MSSEPAEAPDPRRCAYCRRELPASATPRRRFCSSGCRFRHWNVENPYQGGPPPSPSYPVHWHLGNNRVRLVGDLKACGYWRQMDGSCPPGCNGPGDPPGWAIGIPKGKEGLNPPDHPPQKRRRGAISEPTRLRL